MIEQEKKESIVNMCSSAVRTLFHKREEECGQAASGREEVEFMARKSFCHSAWEIIDYHEKQKQKKKKKKKKTGK